MSPGAFRTTCSMLGLLACLGWGLAWGGCASEVPERVWQEEEGYRWAELLPPRKGDPGFTELASSQTGVTFVNALQEAQFLANRHYVNGSGVALGDVDGDGWTDIYLPRLDGDNVLYRNLGNWQFEDITAQADVAAPERFSTGATFADLDGDSDLDLLVTAMGGPNAAFLNDGMGHFTEVTDEAGLSSDLGSTSMALADVDGDGDLDLYVGNYKKHTVKDLFPPDERAFERTVIRQGDGFEVVPAFQEHYKLEVLGNRLMRLEVAESDQMYLNDGSGRFEPISFTDGAFLNEDGEPLTEAPTDWALAVRFQDVNGDGNPDLFVCNDFESPDQLWLGDGEGHFQKAPRLTLRKTSNSTMAVDFADIDRDGHVDFFLADMLSRDYARRQVHRETFTAVPVRIGEIENRPQVMQNALFWNRGDGTFAEMAHMAGIEASEWTWSSVFLDVDLDGYEDLLVTNGHAYDAMDADAQVHIGTMPATSAWRESLLLFPKLDLKNIAFRNRGTLFFDEMEHGWGLGSQEDVSHGLALADLDHDGDLDAVINRLNKEVGVFRNNASASRIAIRLRGLAPNTQGIGATIRVMGGSVEQSKEVISGGYYLSSSDPLSTFAASTADGVPYDSLQIEITWRSGKRSVIEQASANRVYEIYEEGATSDAKNSNSADTSPSFVDESEALQHTHHEKPFDDFAIQPLLPRRLSQQGPGLAFVDVDTDGFDDLLVGSGKGGSLALYSNNRGQFEEQASFSSTSEGDQTGIVVVPQEDGNALVLVGVSSYERGPSDSSYIDVYALNNKKEVQRVDRLSFGSSSIGPLALADVDGDGDLDLFAGGRFVPGRYPEAASSRFFRNDEGQFQYAPTWSAPFEDVGMVSGTAFGDIDQDGDADLILATEWGPLRYFENKAGGRYVDQTDTFGLKDFPGLWQGVALGDFNADGLLDIVASNWGGNGQHGRFHVRNLPLRLYYHDFDLNGVLDVVEAHHEESVGAYVPDRRLSVLSFAIPSIRSRVRSYRQFAQSSVRDIIGPKLDQVPYHQVQVLASMVFMNRGGRFAGRILPLPAQVAPAFALGVADYDGDGKEDVFLSQNIFAVSSDMPRLDGGRGMWLRGEGDGTFTAAEGTETGVKVYGEQRGAALGDYNRDGRVDLIVTQNGNATYLYRNVAAKPGLRVQFVDAITRIGGVGSTVRLKYQDGSLGPARLVAAGSGYWSQSSLVQVLGIENGKEVDAVVVRWPWREETEIPVARGAREVTVAYGMQGTY